MTNQQRKLTWAVNLAGTLPPGNRDTILADLEDQTRAGTDLRLPVLFEQAGLRWFTPKRDIPWLPTPSGNQPPKDQLDTWLEAARYSKRAAAWRWRIGEAMQTLAKDNGWFPIHVTLTVDPARADPNTIMRDKRHWDTYCARWRNRIRAACGLPEGTPVADYLQHCAVIEHGKSREHHHIHALFWARDLPDTWKVDPNIGRAMPNARNIPHIKAMWDWASVTTAEPFRFVGDPWSKIGWMHPLKHGSPMLLQTARRAGSYLAKYLAKEDKAWAHNVHPTRGLGMTDLRNTIAPMDTPTLHALAGPINPMVTTAADCSVPNGLVRITAQETVAARLWQHQAGRAAMFAHAQQPRPNAYSAMRTHTKNHRPGLQANGRRRHHLWAADEEQVTGDLWIINPRSTDNEPPQLQQSAWKTLAERWPADQGIGLRPLAGVATR